MTLARFYSIPTLLQGAALTGSYVLTGLLSLDLSANDGLASMVWPPAGIALAAMLLGGNRFLPAIWLGGFIAVNVTSGRHHLRCVAGTHRADATASARHPV